MAESSILKVAFFSAKQYDKTSFQPHSQSEDASVNIQISYLEPQLSPTTAPLAEGHEGVCLFVNDNGDADALRVLKKHGVRFIALRCAGYNNVDLKEAESLGITIVRVPAYSPDAVAEFTVGMMLTVIRKYYKAYNRVREGNFLLEGLVGSNIKSATIGIIGTGKIGMLTGKILSQGFGARVIAYDMYPNKEGASTYGIAYVETLDDLLAEADIISLHCPLTAENKHMIDDAAIHKMKHNVIIVNTSRGALIDSTALIRGLKRHKIQAVAMDVYEKEEDYFFKDTSAGIMDDDLLARLISFNNVFLTGHQAFLTNEALDAIASTTIQNLVQLFKGEQCANIVK